MAVEAVEGIQFDMRLKRSNRSDIMQYVLSSFLSYILILYCILLQSIFLIFYYVVYSIWYKFISTLVYYLLYIYSIYKYIFIIIMGIHIMYYNYN